MQKHLGWLLCLAGVTACAPVAPAGLETATPAFQRVVPSAPFPTGVVSVQVTAQVITPPAPASDLPATAQPALPAYPPPGLATPAVFGPLPAVTVQRVTTGLNRPLALVPMPDDSGRLLVVEQPGLIRVLVNGQISATPFLDIRNRVNASANEQGLLGLALHPQFARNGLFFVNYTGAQGGTVIARFALSPNDPNRADPASEHILLQVEQPFSNHNGGGLAFGPDGYLYIGLGDGGSGNDPMDAGQRLDTLLGKILRLDVDRAAPDYAIPPDNPFVNVPGARPEIWAYGIRNPWGLAFDPLTGDLWFADVGQNQREEINHQPAGQGGRNYGWRYFEGDRAHLGQPPAGQTFVPPVTVYGRDEGCSVTGGVLYRGAVWPALQGRYLFSDYCSGALWALTPTAQGWERATLTASGARVSALAVDNAGHIYVVNHNGDLRRLAVP